MVQGLAFDDAFGDDAVHRGDAFAGDAPVGPRGVPVPYGKGVGVDAVVVALPVRAVLAFGASVAAVWPEFPPCAFPRLEKGDQPFR